jgi:hypothetical protein
MVVRFHYAIVLMLAALAGCATRIDIAPAPKAISDRTVTRINKVVGYYIPPAELDRKVSALVGDGLLIRYQPYKDLEPGVQRMLSTLFTKVVALRSINDRVAVNQDGLAYIFVPTIDTTTSTEPKTMTKGGRDAKFDVAIDLRALNPDGSTVWQTRKVGRGGAEYYNPGELEDAFARAGRDAGQRALVQLQQEINGTVAFHR